MKSKLIAGVMAAVGGAALALHGFGGALGHARTPGSHKAASERPAVSESGYDLTPLRPSVLAKRVMKLTPEQRHVLLDHGTEPAHCGGLLDNKEQGVYTCALCGLPLFDSSAKFDSGTGWPSFFTPFDPDHITEHLDRSGGTTRTETRCARCDGHLGHVFTDGPRPTRLRYCMNSAALQFYAEGAPLPPESRPVEPDVAYFAGGCFWGVEDAFERYPGVIEAVSGYMGGTWRSPTYDQVLTGKTGHAETVKVVYDRNRVSYAALVDFFFKIHDPTTLNRQGPDVGEQYRSAIFAASDGQLQAAKAKIAKLESSGAFGKGRIVTRVQRGGTFYRAEDYHQDYNARTGKRCHVDIEPLLPR